MRCIASRSSNVTSSLSKEFRVNTWNNSPARIARREEIPAPSPARGRPAAVPGAVLAAKAALYEALREERLSNSAFAAAMGVQESEVRRMLDPRHATKIGRLEEALARFRKRLVITVEAAA